MRALLVVALVALLVLDGCVLHLHAATTVIAPDAQVPVSLSKTVRDADGNLVFPARMRVVGEYDVTFHAYNLPWGIFRLRPTTDLSSSINDAVATVHGDAVTELTIAADECLTALVFLWFVPIVPSCARYRVRGHIVQVLPPAAATTSVP